MFLKISGDLIEGDQVERCPTPQSNSMSLSSDICSGKEGWYVIRSKTTFELIVDRCIVG